MKPFLIAAAVRLLAMAVEAGNSPDPAAVEREITGEPKSGAVVAEEGRQGGLVIEPAAVTSIFYAYEHQGWVGLAGIDISPWALRDWEPLRSISGPGLGLKIRPVPETEMDPFNVPQPAFSATRHFEGGPGFWMAPERLVPTDWGSMIPGVRELDLPRYIFATQGGMYGENGFSEWPASERLAGETREEKVARPAKGRLAKKKRSGGSKGT